jgi:hypothetical protein
MKGKDRCKILKDIRKRIADENDIEFIVSECKHKGDCLGTCPKCESELRYLERELEKRRTLGKKVTVAGLAISVTIATSSCVPDLFSQPTAGVMMPESEESTEYAQLDGETEVATEVPFKGLLADTEEPLMGVPPLEETEEAVDIPGEIYVEEGELPADEWETTSGELPYDDMDETLMGEPVPDSWLEEETDAPVSETVETVAETPVTEN